ncbi:magnesium transporter [Botrimarina hoheduenensis]|uniref:Magnesium transporter MgtE n=1 Tax=Botrimarina hoheduenensis TaxID=2528000 RepID=A0A5C5WEH1_9BACT|nr:magnesium transporter [Botrimarina hoheduenensis]TWT48887.1 Magnesium transporter MgtE [Botrimarina hoheduenensis]
MNTLYLPELREMIAAGDAPGLREFTEAINATRAAEFMEGLTAEDSWKVLLHADPERRVEVFAYFDEHKQADLVTQVARSEDVDAISQLVADLPADDRVDLLNQLDDELVEELLPRMAQEDRRETLRLRGFPEGTAGSVMTTEVGRLSIGMSVSEALSFMSDHAEELETIYTSYVVDEENRLLGMVATRQLIAHYNQPNQPIAELMQRDVVTARAMDDQESVADKVAAYDLLAIPVVDDDRRLLGIITHDDILDVLRAEATEDALLAAGMAPLDHGYLRSHWFTLACNRGMWLSVLFVAALLTALALRGYEEEFQKASWLVLFIPLVISSGGNSGSQSATLVIRGLTDGQVALRDWGRVLRRELLMGLTLGAALATVGYFSAYALTRTTSEAEPAPTALEVAVVPITLLLVVVCGTVCGGALPLLFQRLGVDPALMSNPFVAGIIDIAGIVIYMTVAMAMIVGLG